LIRETDSVGTATWVDGIPLVDRRRAIVDALRFLPADEGTNLLHRCLQLGWINPDQLKQWVNYFRGKSGVGRLRTHHLDSIAGSHSEAEALCVKIINRAKLDGWEANSAVYDAQGLIGYADFLFRGSRLIVEIDGRAWHVDNDRFQSDRTRQNRLINANWRVLRFTWEDLVDRPGDVISAVMSAIR
jgi:very-short-patch-repair endonuclease